VRTPELSEELEEVMDQAFFQELENRKGPFRGPFVELDDEAEDTWLKEEARLRGEKLEPMPNWVSEWQNRADRERWDES